MTIIMADRSAWDLAVGEGNILALAGREFSELARLSSHV